PVTEGSVVLAGESIATIAAKGYLLRLELPERHARFIKVGDPIRVSARGLSPEIAATAVGRITQVYPELKNGRVIAD
ncbi:efflux RND transporter periplasmic adaptor subunit, partial [Escherichia coli]|nr:efflux RND transporter periplasmic adaptor subunit [Escherichia coli]